MTTPTALITGATGGLGIAYAHEFASHGHDVVLVARREAELTALAQEITENTGVNAHVLPCDLNDRADRRRFLDQVNADHTVDVLINNAGFGLHSPFVTSAPEALLGMIGVNCEALVDLTRAMLPGMMARDRGSVINVASTASFQPLPDMAVYAATKAFVVSFTQALWSETKDSKVRVFAVCPGPTETPFWDVAEANNVMTKRRTSQQVVDTTIRAMAANGPVVIDGPQNSVLARLAKVMPYAIVEPLAKQFVKREG